MSAGTHFGKRSSTALAVMAVAAITPLLPGLASPAAAAESHRLCGPPADTVPPQVTSLSFSRHSVNLSHGPRIVTVTAHATDTSGSGPGSGIKFLKLVVLGRRHGDHVRLSLHSGTVTDGVWQGTVRVPQTAHPGTWRLDLIQMSDQAGNQQQYEQALTDGTEELPTDVRVHPDWDQTIKLTGVAPPAPKIKKPGTLTALKFSRTSVNTTHRAKRVTLHLAFNGPRPREVAGSLYIPGNGANVPTYVDLDFKRTTGNHWRDRFTVKRWVGNSRATPSLDVLYGPRVNPYEVYYSRKLKALHLAHSLRITSGADLDSPVLTALSVSPTTVDTRSAARQVTVTAEATDNRSGVSSVEVDTISSKSEGSSGDPPGDSAGVVLKRDGTKWVGTMTFRQCVPAGTWPLHVTVVDRARNENVYDPEKLQPLGFPSQLTVLANPQHLHAPTVIGATAFAADHTITLNFSDGVKNVTPATLTVFALEPAATRYHSSLAISATSCFNSAGSVDCSGTGGLVTSARLDVPVVAAGQQYAVYANLNSITPQLTDGFGNPLSWVPAAARVTGS